MKFSLKTDTLAYQLSRPGMLHRGMGEASCVSIGDQVKKFRSSSLEEYFKSEDIKGKVKGNPEHDAVCFYMMNHAAATVAQRVGPYEPLGKYLPILQKYNEVLSVRAVRMFFYMLLICTRESRHRKDDNVGSIMTALRGLYGNAVCDFNNSIKGTGSEGAADAFCTKPPAATLGQYTKFLTDVFNKGSYSGGYGGKAWGQVAAVLRDYSIGKITAEMMVDTAFTLCHNNGPIFNKGMLFDGYTQEIYKILDVQRAGMIPQYVASMKMMPNDPKSLELASMYATCRDALGECMEGSVDWFKVEALGSKMKYPAEKAEQVKLYGKPDGTPVAQTIKKIPKPNTIEQVSETLGSNSKFVVLHPGCQIKIVEREAA